MDPEMQTLGIQLAATAVRNTASTVADRITTARTRKKDQETIVELEDIVNELIADKGELVRIAQAYEQEMVAQRLSVADVEYVTSNILPVIQNLAVSAGAGNGAAASTQAMMDILKPILSVETVTVLQLIGFNFRQAVGEPLTELVSRLILAKSRSGSVSDGQIARLEIERQMSYIELAKDAEASARFSAIIGQ